MSLKINAAQTRQELRQAIRDCRERRLDVSSKWAAQQLAGMGEDTAGSHQRPQFPQELSSFSSIQEDDAYQLAVSHFDFRVRLIPVLQDCLFAN
jgi:Anaphase promoting complex subunit 8 / Cdc23